MKIRINGNYFDFQEGDEVNENTFWDAVNHTGMVEMIVDLYLHFGLIEKTH